MLRTASAAAYGLRYAASTSTLCRIAPRAATSSSRMNSKRFKSTLKIFPASSSAPREVPTPIIFLTASKWTSSAPAAEAFSQWIQHFSSQGYESVLLDLDPDQPLSDIKDSSKLMELFEKDAIETLRQAGSAPPFPPVMITRGPASLIAQTYVSSRPLTALQLIDPPINNAYLRKDHPELLPGELAEFDFEATFPVRVVWCQAELQRQQDKHVPWYDVHRIEHEREEEADESLDRYTYVEEKQGAESAQEWLEEEVDSLDDIIDRSELAEESPVTSSSSKSNTSLELPDWFTAGDYTLQPGSRKYPLILDEKDLAEKFIRGSGPGGQAINKLSTNVQLTHLPTGTKLTCQETRSRDRNRELARRRMSLTLEKLVRGEGGGSRIDRQIEKERKKKMNKKKKQKKRLREKEQSAPDETKADSSVSQEP
ncbi:Peptide chain release factor class I/class II [Kalmanozyma brasiliensis GHG001]|uniref:Prokaryotic-type class I peptide chain release factors domain-containing protein n=1 Tax=Kalmanozyma brasiliensis (strain GHG001) TaxID=1365824 RepID=V5ECZ4_KALBG|nr:Peptide chain release factor class I/class II [Kalmanozyma brasiliensis GHG001]EST08336.1 Peptide chain release factor class I/class II [Kalmanozyma brasiliensis GHG001]